MAYSNAMPAYRVLLFQSASEQGYSVSCPALPGCWSQEETRREALANIRAAIGEYLQAARTVRSV